MKKKSFLKFLKEWRIILVIVALILSFFWIHPYFSKQGAQVVLVKSPATFYGVTKDNIITSLNGYPVKSVSDYSYALSQIESNTTVEVVFDVEGIPYFYKSQTARFISEERENQTYVGISVIDTPSTKILFGLEMLGGTKVLLKPEKTLSNEEVDNILAILEQRLNTFGIKEIPISFVQDFSGNQYFRIEFAGATPEQVIDLVEREGKFEAFIGNETVFMGEDIISVCIGGSGCHAQITPVSSSGGGVVWQFSFEMFLSQEGAEKFANATDKLGIGECSPEGGCYLNQTITFFVDEEIVSDLKISSSLKGKIITTPSITGGGETKAEALSEMKKLQAILQSGKLPVDLTIDSIETISPLLGQEFAKNIFSVFLLAILGVEIVVLLRYRNFKIALPIMFITLSEVVITLGVASLLSWTFDLAGIAGLIASVGTGVNDQIIITDEVLYGGKQECILCYIRCIFINSCNNASSCLCWCWFVKRICNHNHNSCFRGCFCHKTSLWKNN